MMTSSTVIQNPIPNGTYGPLDSLKRIKKSKTQGKWNNKNDILSWRSKTREQVYKSKLLQALQHVRLGSRASSGRAVREAANRVLAMTAKGRSGWSRAILTNKLNYKSMKSNVKQKRVSATAKRNIRLKKLPTVQRKARDLSRLVPGCRKQSLLVVLEEVADYVSALKMQVKVMAAVADLLSDSERSSSGSGYGG